MTLKGDLDSISLADVFQTLSMTQQEGTLFVQDGESRKAIYFSKNGVSLITSAAKKGGKLGDMLVGLGKITPEQLEEALSIHREANVRLGEAMIRLGFVTEKDIENAVRSQIEEEIYDLFSWENATFEFVEGAPPDGTFDGDEGPVVTQLTFNVNSLIMEAARRIDEWDLIEKVIPSVQEIFSVDAKRLNPMEYTDRERLVLQHVDGRNTVKEVVEKSHVPRFDVCKFLYRLVEEGKAQRAAFENLLEYGDEAVRDENLPEAVKFYEQALTGKIKKKSDQFKARLRLAQALEYLDRKKEAADEYKFLADAKIEERDVEGAINIWQKVIDLNPLDLENKERLINVYLENRGHLDPGRSDVIRSIEYSLFKNGKSLAMAFAYAGQIDRAKDVLNRLIELVPSNVELRKALANIHVDAGEKAEAIEELEQIAQHLLANRQFSELLDVYKSILKIEPSRNDIRKKIQMIEAGESVGPHTGRRGKGAFKKIAAVFLILVVLGAAGAAGYYFLTAYKEWNQASDEAHDLWMRSREKTTSALEKKELRTKARDLVRPVPGKYPYAGLDARLAEILKKWENDEIQEEEDLKQSREMRANRVRAECTRLEKIYRGTDPLDVAKILKDIAQVEADAADNPFAREPLQTLKEWGAKFQGLRKTAEDLLARAKAHEARAEETGEYGDLLAKAWEKYAELFVKGDRFPDLLNQVRLPIRFESQPPEADLFINGEGPFKTPTTHHKIPRTPLALRVARLGYRDQERNIDAEDLRAILPKEFPRFCYYRFDLEIVPLADFLLEKESVFSDPVAAGGRLFVANDSGDIMAFSWHGTGHLRKAWAPLRPSKHPLNPGFRSRLLASSKYVFFPCEDGAVYRLDLELKGPPAGSLFKYDPAAGGDAHIIRERGGAALSSDESVLIVGTDRGVSAFQVADGTLLWQYRLENPDDRAWSVPLCHEGKVYAGTLTGKILAFDIAAGPKDGTPLWQTPATGSAIRSPLAIHEGVLYAGTEDGNLRIVELARGDAGARMQFIQADTPITGKPLFRGGFLFLTAGSFLYKLQTDTLVEVWREDYGGRSGKVSDPVIFGPSLFVGNGDGSLYSIAWEEDTARVRWHKTLLPGAISVRPAVDHDGAVYFLSQDKSGVRIALYRE